MKRLLSLVLALTVILGTFMLPTWANDGAGAASNYDVGDYYAIPADAEYVKIGEDVYKVIRTYAEFVDAFDGVGAETGQKFILANDIDCSEQVITDGQFTFFPAMVLEGNGFSLLNVENCPNNGIFSFVIGDTITFKNLTIGSKAAPLSINYHHDGDKSSNVPLSTITASYAANTYWENCHIYANLYTDCHGSTGLFMGNANLGELTMVNCTVTGSCRSDAPDGKGDAGMVAGGSGSAQINLTGVDFFGSVYSKNNSGTAIGWCSTSLTLVDCNNYATVVSDGSNHFAGGFIGNAQQNATQSLHFTNCVNYGNITSAAQVGGFLGQSRTYDTVLENCVNFGTITGGKNAASIAGQGSSANTSGAGRHYFKAINCLNAGTINGGEHTGGFIGWGGANLDGCVNIGLIDGATTAGNLGGKPYAEFVKNCLSLGPATNSAKTSAGIADIGNFGGSNPTPVIENNRVLDTLVNSFATFGAIETEEVSDGADGTKVVPTAAAKISMEDALALLEEKFPAYKFIVDNGMITVNQTALRAAQHSAAEDGEFNIRLLGTISTLNLAKVGFTGTVTYTENGTEQTKALTLAETGTTLVHKTVLAGTASVSAADLIGEYIYTLKLTGLPAVGTVKIEAAPVSVLIGEDETVVTGATTTIYYEDGQFVGTGTPTTPVVLEKVTVDGTGSSGGQDPDNQGIYDIPEGATTYELDGEIYTVVRTYEEFREALKGVEVTVGSGLGATTEIGYGALRVILADDINGNGAILDPAVDTPLLIGKGSIIEGNGYCLYNYSGVGLFDIQADASVSGKVVVRNFSLGDEKAMLTVITNAADAGLYYNNLNAGAETEWINCNIYANLFATGGSTPSAFWFGRAKGTHTFTNCDTYGAVSSSQYAAALIAYTNDGDTIVNVTDCDNYAAIYGGGNAGGFIGTTKQKTSSGKLTFTNCTNNAKVQGNEAGGFISKVRTDVELNNCVNNGEVVGKNYAGGFIPRVTNEKSGTVPLTVAVTNCVNNADITCAQDYAGGIVSILETADCGLTVNNFVNTGDITAPLAAGGVVGLVKVNAVSFVNCLNTGDITSANAAGIVGEVENTEATQTVSVVTCANIGTITQTAVSAGAGTAANIGGMLTATDITIADTYAFGKVVGTDDIGALVSDQSFPTTVRNNEYVEYGSTASSDNNGLTGVTAKTVAQAIELLNARYAGVYTFAEVEGVIVATVVE